MDGSKKSVPKKEDETIEEEKAACESDKELEAICWVSLICRLFDKNTTVSKRKNQNSQRLLRLDHFKQILSVFF
jgi:hypothetical protein